MAALKKKIADIETQQEELEQGIAPKERLRLRKTLDYVLLQHFLGRAFEGSPARLSVGRLVCQLVSRTPNLSPPFFGFGGVLQVL